MIERGQLRRRLWRPLLRIRKRRSPISDSKPARRLPKRAPVPEPLVRKWYVQALDTAKLESENAPLIKKDEWYGLPYWIHLYQDRGRGFKCFYGHKCEPTRATHYSNCYKCAEHPLPQGIPMYWCRTCTFWGCCINCTSIPRLPSLAEDPLFHGRDHPCLLELLRQRRSAQESYRGTVIICPGGNYEFLVANEANPVAAWLADNGIRAYVLRYRLLPWYELHHALEDLSSAVDKVRLEHEGPVCAIGFSAGGHLIASLSAKAAEEKRPIKLDAQVLCYPGLDTKDWQSKDECGFVQLDACLAKASSLTARQEALLGGPGFAAPPTFLVASEWDKTCPPESTSDLYAAALKASEVTYKYLRDDFGQHGFALDPGPNGGWTDSCIEWLAEMGIGKKIVSQ